MGVCGRWHNIYTVSAHTWRNHTRGATVRFCKKSALQKTTKNRPENANFATIKNFSRNLSTHIILVLDATFVPNLTFLGLLSPEISFGEKTVTQIPSFFRHP